MKKPASWLLSAGLLLLIGLLASRGLTPVFAVLATAGWGLLWVALFHLLPLALDAAAIRVLFHAAAPPGAWRSALFARWAGESANSLMPLGQLAGPVVMARHLSRRGMPAQDAAAVITVSTTLQTLAQIAFGLMGVALLTVRAGLGAPTAGQGHRTVIIAALTASVALTVILASFYLVQRRGLFGGATRLISRFAGRRDWSVWMSRANAIDLAVESTYRRGSGAATSFALSLGGWLIGTGEVYLALRLLGSPVGWPAALLLESLGQAVRGAAFFVPGALGVQEGGYLLLAPFAGLAPDAALALSFAKRAREIALGVPGLLYLHRCEQRWRRLRCAAAAQSDGAFL